MTEINVKGAQGRLESHDSCDKDMNRFKQLKLILVTVVVGLQFFLITY